MADDFIPLYEGELSGARIVHDNDSSDGVADRGPGPSATNATQSLRRKRQSARKPCEQTCVCLTPNDPSGRIEHVACPVIDISKNGFSLEFDRHLAVGITGSISYRTVSHRPVHVSCCIRHCQLLENGRYRLGIKLDRELNHEELKPAKTGFGRDVAPGVRTRKLRPVSEDDAMNTTDLPSLD
ncbi:MAG: PilZ domain-containing protein [Phycisphaerales bacterium]|nr:PilZ domain-containing protein [Phycisphaerales bacterium]